MSEQQKYVTVTADSFHEEVLEAGEPVLLDFYADWCGPCRAMAPAMDELAEQFSGRAKIAKIDVDENSEIAKQFSVRSIPSLLIFQDGQVVDKTVGTTTKGALADKLERYVAMAA